MMCPVPDQPDLLFLLHDLARQLRVLADRRARAHGMTRAQWVILWWLERQPGLSQKELAEIMDVEPITVARLVDRLTRRAMVERRDDPADRRIWRLHLLPAALPVLASMRGEREQVQQILITGLDTPSIDVVGASLVTMKANIMAESRARHTEQTAPPPIAPRRRPSMPATIARATDISNEPTLQQDRV